MGLKVKVILPMCSVEHFAKHSVIGHGAAYTAFAGSQPREHNLLRFCFGVAEVTELDHLTFILEIISVS